MQERDLIPPRLSFDPAPQALPHQVILGEFLVFYWIDSYFWLGTRQAAEDRRKEGTGDATIGSLRCSQRAGVREGHRKPPTWRGKSASGDSFSVKWRYSSCTSPKSLPLHPSCTVESTPAIIYHLLVISHVAAPTDPPPTSSEDHGEQKHSLHGALIPEGNGMS